MIALVRLIVNKLQLRPSSDENANVSRNMDFVMQDADMLLDKRVRSRFSHRKLLFLPPANEDIQR